MQDRPGVLQQSKTLAVTFLTLLAETAELQCHQLCPLCAQVSPTAQLYSTVLLGQTGPAGYSSDQRLGETVAWQEGGGSWQEDIGKAVRLEHKDADQHLPEGNRDPQRAMTAAHKAGQAAGIW